MRKLGFCDTFVDWIKDYISNIPFLVICNGSIYGYFSSINGLHQGCPLSPLLFTMVMDIFSSLLELEVGLGNFIPLYSRSIVVLHLLFTDDVLIFDKANYSTIQALHRCLLSLELANGLIKN